MENCNDCQSKSAEITRLHNICKTTKYYALYNIYLFTQNSDFPLFVKLFDKQATHLWDKFRKGYKYDVIQFYNSLDDENKHKLDNYMQSIL